jgi:hypothetical protein
MVCACELVVLIRVHTLRTYAPLEALDHLVSLLVRHDLGDLYLTAFGDDVEHTRAELTFRALLCGGLQLLSNGDAQFVQGLELARLLDELVVERRQIALFDLLDVHVEEHRLAPERLLVVIHRESDAELPAFVGVHPDDVLLEIRQELAAPDLEQVVLGLGPLQRTSGQPLALEVQDHEVSLLDRPPLDGGQGGELGLQLLDPVLYILLGDLHLAPGDFDALVVS